MVLTADIGDNAHWGVLVHTDGGPPAQTTELGDALESDSANPTKETPTQWMQPGRAPPVPGRQSHRGLRQTGRPETRGRVQSRRRGGDGGTKDLLGHSTAKVVGRSGGVPGRGLADPRTTTPAWDQSAGTHREERCRLRGRRAQRGGGRRGEGFHRLPQRNNVVRTVSSVLAGGCLRGGSVAGDDAGGGHKSPHVSPHDVDIGTTQFAVYESHHSGVGPLSDVGVPRPSRPQRSPTTGGTSSRATAVDGVDRPDMRGSPINGFVLSFRPAHDIQRHTPSDEPQLSGQHILHSYAASMATRSTGAIWRERHPSFL